MACNWHCASPQISDDLYVLCTVLQHCDNNEVLRALCKDAGWIVEDDGTTYKKVVLTSAVSACQVCRIRSDVSSKEWEMPDDTQFERFR